MKKLRKKLLFLMVALFAAFMFTGCAEVSPHAADCVTSDPYGFLGGLWHGLILFFSFIGSLFNDDIVIYSFNNSGGWYDFGFMLGIGAFSGGASSAKK